MSYDNIKVAGFKEARKMLDQLSEKFQYQAIMPVFRKAIKPVVQTGRQNLLQHGSQYRKLAKSIGVWRGKSRKSPNLFAGPRVKGKWSHVGYIAHWVEYGTTGVKKDKGTRKASYAGYNPEYAKRIGKLKQGDRFRRDEPPRPFMRPAIDSEKSTVERLVEKGLQTELNNLVKKQLKKMKL
jgi:hypothetical protein